MNCMKCGREIPLGQVFCKDCLADMDNYPVKPGTPVILPTAQSSAPPRRIQSVRKVRKPEEQIKSLRKTVLWLSLALLTVALTFAITTSVLLHQINKDRQNTLPGQNYSTMEETAS